MIVTVFLGDEWEGLYLDGELRMQADTLDLLGVLDEMCMWSGEPIRSVRTIVENGDWLVGLGSLPDTLKELEELNGK